MHRHRWEKNDSDPHGKTLRHALRCPLRMSNRRITQQDIAKAAGVSRSTVTYALNAHPKIPEQTRLKIEAIARELGYMPDPMLSSLAYYRNSKRDSTYRGLLAWLVYQHYDWSGSPHYLGYFNGARERASHHGYRLEVFHLDPLEASETRTASILRARGISGILLCPLPSYNLQIQFPWEHFSLIAFGYTLKSPRLNSVASAHFSNARQAFAQLLRKGYRRIGLVIDQITDLRCNNAVSSAFTGEQIARKVTTRNLIPVHFDQMPERGTPQAGQKMAEYIKKHRLDAIITEDITVLERLRACAPEILPHVGVAGLNLPQTTGDLSGIVEASEHIGAHAVDLLAGMIQRAERGIPPFPIRSHVEGVWHEGKSTPGVPAEHPHGASEK